MIWLTHWPDWPTTMSRACYFNTFLFVTIMVIFIFFYFHYFIPIITMKDYTEYSSPQAMMILRPATLFSWITGVIDQRVRSIRVPLLQVQSRFWCRCKLYYVFLLSPWFILLFSYQQVAEMLQQKRRTTSSGFVFTYFTNIFTWLFLFNIYLFTLNFLLLIYRYRESSCITWKQARQGLSSRPAELEAADLTRGLCNFDAAVAQGSSSRLAVAQEGVTAAAAVIPTLSLSPPHIINSGFLERIIILINQLPVMAYVACEQCNRGYNSADASCQQLAREYAWRRSFCGGHSNLLSIKQHALYSGAAAYCICLLLVCLLIIVRLASTDNEAASSALGCWS